MKKLSTKTQAKNAIFWLEKLVTTKRLKGVSSLRLPKGGGQHNENRHEYCCLGIGCKVFNIKPKEGWDSGNDDNFNEKVGISNLSLIWNINDLQFENDKDFKRVRKALIEQADNIFIPEVAKAIQKHFLKKKKSS